MGIRGLGTRLIVATLFAAGAAALEPAVAWADVSIADAFQIEGDSGTSTMSFAVILDAPAPPGGFTVNYSTGNVTATAGSDYTQVVAGTVTIDEGLTAGPADVTITGDAAVEANETFTVTLSNPSGGIAIGDGSATGTIQNDDGLTLVVDDPQVAEGNAGSATLTFNVVIDNGVAGASPVTVNYATADVTATAGSDYTAANGTLTFTTGQNFKTVSVTISGDATTEASETLTLTLSSPTGATLSDATGTGTISNDDGLTLTIQDNGVTEGNPPVTPTLNLVVTLSGVAPSGGVSVNYATSNGTASAGSDYVAASGILTILAGNSFETIPITVTGDTAVEDFEFFIVTLSSPVGATIADGTAEGFIINDDFWPACGAAPCYTNFGVDLDGATGGLTFAAPPAGLALEAFGVAGFVQIQLRYTPAAGSADYELVNATGSPITTNSVIQFTLNTGSIDPAGFFATGVVDSFTATSNSLTVQIRPQSSSWLFVGCDPLGCGGPTTEADFTFGGIVFAAAFDFGSASTNDDFRGSYISTNAQQFAFGTAGSGQVEFTLAAPHYKKRAIPSDPLVVNTGFVKMFFRDAVLTDIFGISDPSSVNSGTFVVEKTSGGVTTSVNFSVTRVTSPVAGVLIEAGTGAPGLTPFEFSTPTFTVKKAPPASSGGGSTGGSGGGGASTPSTPSTPPATPTVPGTPTAGVPFVGTDAAEVLSLGNAGFILTTGGGSDVVRTGAGEDRVALGTGNDVALLGAGDDRAFGGAGNDVLLGGAGNDRLTGGPGIDRLVGGSGDDVLDLRDGRPGDRAACGLGRDVVYADRGDRIARDCEVIRWAR